MAGPSTRQRPIGRFRGRGAIVTGANGPLGAALTRALLRDGAYVVAIDDDEPGFTGLGQAESQRCLTYAADITTEASVAAVIREVRQHLAVRHVFNAAEFGERDSASRDTVSWDRAFAVNVRAPFLVCKYAIPQIARHGGGTVVNVGSAIAPDADLGATPAYWASKAALIGLTRALAAEHAAQGVRVNCLALRAPVVPGPSGTTARVGGATTSASAAAAALRLAGDDAAHVTGAVLPVADGGVDALQ